MKLSAIPRTSLLLAATLLPAAALADTGGTQASAQLQGLDGQSHGVVYLSETAAGVLLRAELTGLPAGVLAFHIHEAGSCEPPFASAGGHFNPGGHRHGILQEQGGHAGDMPNLHVPASGRLTVEVLNTAVTLAHGAANSLFGSDGTSIVIHAGADDYRSDPAGDAGTRIACGVITR